MKIIDFRFRPHTEAILNGIKNSAMFKASCEHMGFDKWKPEPLDKIVADIKALTFSTTCGMIAAACGEPRDPVVKSTCISTTIRNFMAFLGYSGFFSSFSGKSPRCSILNPFALYAS